jgi:hypothetical protein
VCGSALFNPGAKRVCERSDLSGEGRAKARARGAEGPPKNLKTHDATDVVPP